MGGKTPHSALGDALTAEDVATYLRETPDFLQQHPDVVHHLIPPAENRGNGVADLQHFMLLKLRREVADLTAQREELIATARANINNQSRVHAAVLFLMDAQNFEHLIQTITTDLAVLLDLDLACLVVEQPEDSPLALHADRTGLQLAEAGAITRWLNKRDVVLRGNIQGMAEIYGPAAPIVRSEALVRLTIGPDAPVGLLAFGSRDADLFHPGQGTELLCFLARVVERCIRGWLAL
ncbi:DUF484 family protein [Azospirillum sp. B4]|uniref:DUF484 family protein n=1 Tax=Azospirillum sp. B4 TaxID=95605 RepID=UPI00034D053E|nr:DUF484 family protein [Azospirillum sp. B4]